MTFRIDMNIFFMVISSLIIPLYFSMFRFSIFGAIVRPSDLLIILVVLGGVIFSKSVRIGFLYKFNIPIYMYSIFIFFHSLYFVNLEVALKETIQFLMIISFLIVNMSLLKLDSKLYITCFMIGLWCSVVFAVLYHFSLGYFTHYKLAADARYGFGLLSVFSLLLYTRYKNTSYIYSFIISLIPLFLSFERKGILAIIVICVLLSLLALFDFIKFSFKFFLFLSVFFSLIALTLNFEVIQSYYSFLVYSNVFIDESEALYVSNIHRTSLIINGVDIFFNNYIFGVGADRVPDIMGDYYFNPKLGNEAHNFYLDMLIKFGIVGFVIFLLSYVYFIYKYRYFFKKENYLLFVYCFIVGFFMAGGAQSLVLAYIPIFLFSVFSSNSRINPDFR